MKKLKFTLLLSVNADGFVAQERRDVVGLKRIPHTGFFESEDVLMQTLARWSRIWNYTYYTSKSDEKFNTLARPINYATVDPSHPKATIAWTGAYEHNSIYISPIDM